MNYKKIFFISFVLLATMISISDARKKSKKKKSKNDYTLVVAEGTGDIREAGVSEAADRAYLDAQRKAIETALGKMYSAKTVVEAGRFIDQTIMSNIEGYIKKWSKIAGPEIQEFPGIEDKIVWVKIEAQVGKNKLKEDTMALEEIQRRLGRPDIAIIIENSYAGKVLSNKLKEKKFNVREISKEDNEDPVEVAVENEIEIIIDGEVSASSAGNIMKGVAMKSFQSDVVFKAINTSDGAVLSQTSGHGAYPHINDEAGKAGAIEKAAETAAENLSQQILSGWEDVLNNGNNLYLRVAGISLEDESDLKMVFNRYLRGLKEVHSKGFKNGIFTYKLKYLGDAKQLAKELSGVKSKFNVKITGYRVNTVEVEIKTE